MVQEYVAQQYVGADDSQKDIHIYEARKRIDFSSGKYVCDVKPYALCGLVQFDYSADVYGGQILEEQGQCVSCANDPNRKQICGNCVAHFYATQPNPNVNYGAYKYYCDIKN